MYSYLADMILQLLPLLRKHITTAVAKYSEYTPSNPAINRDWSWSIVYRGMSHCMGDYEDAIKVKTSGLIHRCQGSVLLLFLLSVFKCTPTSSSKWAIQGCRYTDKGCVLCQNCSGSHCWWREALHLFLLGVQSYTPTCFLAMNDS